MSALDTSRLLQPVSPEQPCGVDLEYDAAFLALSSAAEPKPERQMGDSVLAGEEPDWRGVKLAAIDLFGRTKDLRVAVLLCRAVLQCDGLPGFASALGLVRALLDTFWKDVHPQLDAADGDDPAMRVNAVVGLADASGLLKTLRDAPLVKARMSGNFSLRLIDAALGRQPGGADTPTADIVNAAFQEAPLEQIEAAAAAIGEARDAAKTIAATLAAHLGPMAPDLAPLTLLLAAQSRELAQRLAARGSTSAAAGDLGDVGGSPSGAVASGSVVAPAASGGMASATVASREDVVRWIDRICDYYRQKEPSSPVPLLLGRARMLVDKSFLDVIRDLVPDGLKQAEMFGGPQEGS